jgi:hypothetical protein
MPKKYLFSQSQLATYIDAFTGQKGTVVIKGKGGGASTHVPSRIVSLPIGTSHAQVMASHEALHITSTDAKASNGLDQTEQLILNVLEDGRMERKSFHHKRGLRHQFQEQIVDSYFSQLVKEPWIIQGFKCFYLEIAGYKYDRSQMKPRAQKVIALFVDRFVNDVRSAKSTQELVPMIPSILALFDIVSEQIKGAGRKAKKSAQPNSGDSVQGVGQKPDEARTSQSQGEGVEGGNSDKSGNHASHNPSQEEGEGRSEGIRERTAETYDAVDSTHSTEAISRMGAEGGGGGQRTTDKYDQVVNGATAESIRKRVRSIAKRIEALRLDGEETQYKIDNVPSRSVPIKPSYAVDRSLIGDIDLEALDTNSVIEAKSSGTVGYRDQGISVRAIEYSPINKPANMDVENQSSDAIVAPTSGISNALAMQMRTISQTAAGRRIRRNQRNGKVDIRRVSQIKVGRFDVFNTQDNGNPSGAAFVLSVDLSGSMYDGGYGYGASLGDAMTRRAMMQSSQEKRWEEYLKERNSYGLTPEPKEEWLADDSRWHLSSVPLEYALQTVAITTNALTRVNIPHEIHGFSSDSVGIVKKFKTRFNNLMLSKMWSWGGGGTPAPEALAIAWERLKSIDSKRRVIVQITDGAVSDNTKDVVNSIRSQGGVVIGIGIGAWGISDENASVYGNDFIKVEKIADLPAKMGRLLRRMAAQGIIG